jgi:hypothetical protein
MLYHEARSVHPAPVRAALLLLLMGCTTVHFEQDGAPMRAPLEAVQSVRGARKTGFRASALGSAPDKKQPSTRFR